MRQPARRAFAVPLVIVVLLVGYVLLLAGVLRREDLASLTDRAEARLALAAHLASAADECWWQLTSGVASPRVPKRPARTFFDVFAAPAPDPLAFRASFEPALTRASVPADDGTTLDAAAVEVPSWDGAARLPQGLVHLTVTGRASLRRGRASLCLHQLRRFWVYALPQPAGPPRLVSAPLFTREITAQWIEEV